MEKEPLWTRGFVLDTFINLGIYIIYYMLMVVIAVEALHMGATVAEAGLATGIYIIGVLLARLIGGRYIELIGRKKMLYAGVIFYLLTTVLYFAFNSMTTLYGVRLLNGIGYGVAATATGTIIAGVIPQSRRGEGINYFALSLSLAAGVGPLLGMLLQDYFSFAHIINFCIAILGACLLATFFLPVEEIELSPEKLAELKSLRLDNFIEPRVLAISTVAFFMGICYSGVLSFLGAYTKELGLEGAGPVFFVVYAIVITVIRPFAGVMFDRKGEDFVMYPCYLALFIGLMLLGQAQGMVLMIASSIFIGLGYGTFMSNGQAICVKLTPAYRSGIAVSTYFIMLDVGLGFGPYFLGAFKEIIGFNGIYEATAVGSLACAAIYYLAYARKRDRNAQDELAEDDSMEQTLEME